ncbi:MAG: hypothetical protein JNM38_16025 [Acidobacteria bacterium]|nr:hypothetical protein [Acidobacteriota bacterium]
MRARFPLAVLSSLVLLVTAGLAGCNDSSTSPSSPLRDEFVLAPGGTATVSDGSARITFTEVAGDSRCPGDAVCILGGDAIVRIAVTTATRRATHDLHTGSMAPVTHDELTITLVELMPYPFSSRPFTPDAYRATLRVTRP